MLKYEKILLKVKPNSIFKILSRKPVKFIVRCNMYYNFRLTKFSAIKNSVKISDSPILD